jgi:hypothetical protein
MSLDISVGGDKEFVDKYGGKVQYEVIKSVTDKQLQVVVHSFDSTTPVGAFYQIFQFENALKTAAKEAGKTQLVITSYDVPRDGILQNQGYTGNAVSVKKLISLVAGGRRNTRRNRKNRNRKNRKQTRKNHKQSRR